MVGAHFGYRDDSPTLRNLLIRLLVSDLSHQLAGEAPAALEHLRLGTANAVVCLAQWRDSASKGASFNALSAEVAPILHLPDLLHGLEAEVLLDVMTFFDAEEAIVRGLLRRDRRCRRRRGRARRRQPPAGRPLGGLGVGAENSAQGTTRGL